jgi:DNA-binding beta-propeller fold protein YncE
VAQYRETWLEKEMNMDLRRRCQLGNSPQVRLSLLLTTLLLIFPYAVQAQLMIIGNDEKIAWDDAGKVVLLAPGKDTVSIVDIGTHPETPTIIANLPLMNSIFGPPTNLAITPDERLALIANSMTWVQEGGAWKSTPDNKLYIIDLQASPPRHLATLEVGKQPSGLAINPRGDLALVTNRADNSISVLSIQQQEVKLIDTVAIGEQVAAVAFTPDGKRVLAVKFPAHKVAVLDVEGQHVTYGKYDMPVGLWPYNIDVTPNGKLALTADNGNAGSSDGHVDTVSVIDLEADPPRVIDHVVVGDAPEGFAISPRGDLAVAVLLRGSNVPKSTWFYHRNGSVVVLKIDGKTVMKVGEIEVGGLPEGVVFSPDGNYLYVGNFLDSDVSILKVDGTRVTDTGKRMSLPGHPASMRGRTR